MESKSHFLLIPVIVIALLFVNLQSVSAQAKKSQGFDMKGFLKRIDANSDGVVDPSEISDDRTRRFLERSGVDISQPITIAAATKQVKKQIQKSAAKKQSDKSGNLVTGFTVTERDQGSTNGFAVSKDERQPAEKKSSSLSKEASENAERQTQQTLATYDRNKDGSLDPEEMRRARWGSPPPSESDRNKDGSLSRGELLARYQNREKAKSKPTDRSSRSSGRSDRSRTSRSSRRNVAISSTSKTQAAASATSTAKTRQATDSYKKYVDGLFQTYDKDGDGKLSAEEIEKMRRKPKGNADSDKDGFTTKQELVDFYTKRTQKRSGSSSDSISDKEKTRSSRSRRGESSSRSSKSSGSLSTLDKDGNGYIEMNEYSSEWDDDIVAEYYKKDTNRDGVITPEEWNGK